jgi:uroporphyrinogen III methyltransferase/synthase
MNIGEKQLRVISRNSPLAILQVREAFSFFPSVRYHLLTLDTYGDRNKQVSLMDAVPADFFTRELDGMLAGDEADVAVHSAKDLPYPLPPGLEVFALLEAFDRTDSLVSKNSLTLEQLPEGASVGTSSAARKAELLSRRPDLAIVSIRGTIEERIARVDSGAIDALVVATCALKRLGLESRIACTLPFKTHPLQGSLAITGRRDRPEIKALFASKDVRQNYGKVTLVGFGPGNPDLLTIGGNRVLAEADVIFHDDLLEQVFLDTYPGEKVHVGKRKGNHRYHQEEINELVYRAAVSGRQVVRLKGGDPMIFAHGREEIDCLQSRFVEVEVIPGISSGIALAACTHIPLTHRGVASSVAFVTGHSGDNVQLPSADTLVCYMGGAHVASIAGKLIASGRSRETPVALAYNVSLPDQKIYYSSLEELQYSVIKYPTPILVIVGEVVSFESRESQKQNVLVTGTSTGEYAKYANLTHTPLIRIRKIRNNAPLQASLKEIHSLDWIVFTSRHGVRCFFEAASEMRVDMRAFSGIRFASVGKTTSSELGKHGIYPDLEPEIESAEGLAACFRRLKLTDKRILLPRSDKGLKYLPEELMRLGNRVIDIQVYRNTVNGEAKKTDLSRFQKIIFSSPSGVEAFMQLYGEIPPGVQLVAKGNTTKKELMTKLSYATI